MMKYFLLSFVIVLSFNLKSQPTFQTNIDLDSLGNSFNAPAITETSNGDIYVAGVSWHEKNDIRLVKLNSSGLVEFDTIYRFTPSHEFNPKLIPAHDGGVLLGSTSYSYPEIDQDSIQDILIWKIDEKGVIEWQKVLIARSFADLTPTKDGNYAVFGAEFNEGLDFLVYKINRKGEIIWKNTYTEDNKKFEHPQFIFEIDGDIYLTGRQTGNSPQPHNLLYKINSDGKWLWSQHISVSDDYVGPYKYIRSVFKFKGKMYFTGGFFGLHRFYERSGDFISLQDSTNFDITFVNRNCSDYENLTGIQTLEEGNHVLRKFDNLNEITFESMIETDLEIIQGSLRSKDGGFIILARPQIASFFQITKLDCSGNLEFWSDECNDIIPQNSTVLIYPNPSQNLLNIEANFSFSSIEIYDSKGSKTTTNNFCECGKQTIDISFLASGVYLLIIKGDSQSYTKKLIKF